MNDAKVFQERNVVATCDYINKYCELYVNNTSILSTENVKSFHNYFPTLLVHIFGSPTTRGWMQTEIQLAQDTAIKNLLSVNGHFFQALLKLSTHSEYSYDLVTETLPNDVKKVLSSGATYLLPRVYANCSYLVTQSTTDSIDIRAAATRQSTLIPATIGGDRKIRFNMLQFYLYYFVNVPTWPPLVESSPNTFNRQTTTAPQYSTVRPTTTTNTNNNYINTNTNTNTSNTYNNTNTSTPSTIQGKARSVTAGPYKLVLEDYMNQFIPIKSNDGFLPIVRSFFFDACVELWIRSTWIVSNAKLSSTLMHYITTFVKYIVHHDLKQCFNEEPSLISDIYRVVKDEVYTLISRLALNWSKHDSYLQVMDLWCIWTAPWKLGVEPRSSDRAEYNPIFTGWCPFILDNLPFYFTLVDIFLQRTSTFLYKDSIQPTQNNPIATYVEGGTISGQLRIVYRLINVFKANGLVHYLGLIESTFIKLQSISANDSMFKQISMQSYGTETMNRTIYVKLRAISDVLAKLEGEQGSWKPKGLYTQDIVPRSDPLLKTLNALNTTIVSRTQSLPLNVDKSSKQVTQLREAYKVLQVVFKIIGDDHLNMNTESKMGDLKGPANSNHAQTKWIGPRVVGQNNGGFLTPEEKQLLREGKAVCSQDNIPILGDRAIHYVRSYEIPFMVRWVIRTDIKLNNLYDHYLPKEKRPKFLFDKLTLRPFARRVNFLYTVATLLLLFYFFIKMIF